MPTELPPGTAAYNDDHEEPSNGQFLRLLGLGLSGLLVLLIGIHLALNGLVEVLVWRIPPDLEQQLGQQLRSVMSPAAPSSPAQQELQDLLNRLQANLPPTASHPYQVSLVPEETINAVALPGNQILVYQGLIEAAESENELMMVLGHELGHFANRDHLRGIVHASLVQIIRFTLWGDSSGWEGAATSLFSTVSRAQYSQQQERQADRVGLDLLYATYGHVAGATDFFNRLSQSQDPGIASFLATHPDPGQRVKELDQVREDLHYPLGTKSPLPMHLSQLGS